MSLTKPVSNLWSDNGVLGKLILLVFAAFVVVTVVFAGYYYWDRYVHLGDESPVEKGGAHLEEMVRDNPDEPSARLALAQYYMDSGSYEEAINQSEQILKVFPENDGALLINGVSQVRMGQPEAAIEPLEAFVAIHEEGEMAKVDTLLEASLYFLGESYLAIGETDQAINSLNKAIAINKTDADALYLLGLAYNAGGQHQMAVDQFHSAILFVPDFTEAYQGMIESYTALGQPSYVAFARGMEAYSTKDYQTARTHLERAIGGLPSFAPAHVGLGLTLEQIGNMKEAKASLERALELHPNDFMATHALGRIEQQLAGSVEG
jgi:tetratricopeptide (TPR) repeat protein